MSARQPGEFTSPFITVGGRKFTPGEGLRDDPVRAGFVGRVLAIQAMTSEGLLFVKDPDNSSGQIGFFHTQGTVEPPLTELEIAS